MTKTIKITFAEKHNVFEFFKEISGTKRFKKGLKEMLDNDF